MTPIRLRRSLPGRALGSVVQFLCFLGLLATIGLAVDLAVPSAREVVSGESWYQLAVPVLLAVCWVLGATGHAEVDDVGVRWRHFRRVQLPWQTVDTVTLGRTRELGQGPFAAYPAVIVTRRGGGGRVVATRGGAGVPVPRATVGRRRPSVLGPPLARGSHVREFGAAVAQIAARHGVPVHVTDDGWGLPVTGGRPVP